MDWDLPIAETFISVQGEGQWAGTLMYFLRLAGCNVGKPHKALKIADPFPVLPSQRTAMACTSWDGRSFPCDTDYSLTVKIPYEQIVDAILTSRVQHVCVTGGEPLLHHDKIENLYHPLDREGVQIHIETSGTITPRLLGSFHKLLLPGYWITCSPKINAQDEMIKRADELKLLVDEHFDENRLTPSMIAHRNVFVCPINGVDSVDEGNVELCLRLLHTHPSWRMSVQIHKLFGWR